MTNTPATADSPASWMTPLRLSYWNWMPVVFRAVASAALAASVSEPADVNARKALTAKTGLRKTLVIRFPL